VNLEASKSILQRAVDEMACGFLARTSDGTILDVNQRLLSWCQYDANEIVGQSLQILVPIDVVDILQDELQAINDGDLRARLTALRRKDGTAFPVLTVPARLTDDEGRLVGILSVVIDLGTVQTAKTVTGPSSGLRGSLTKIALELQSLAITVDSASAAPLSLDHEALSDLSPREGEVIALLLAGDRVPAIATTLHISPHTVRNHLKSVFRKLEVGSQSELIQLLRRIGGSPSSDSPQ
jgi:PAS domain S-box-containing protein